LESLEQQTDCGYDGTACVGGCETDAASACGTEFLAYYACLDEQPAADFVCVEMTFTLQGGACDAQTTALTTCIGG
jgi:hypothetical protein